ncbi:MAG: DUF1232 domain-containing protein [Akkermansiaceae bacterium]|nr:DUF1232 domain-containing protein [Akkermansiaceae bacterium]
MALIGLLCGLYLLNPTWGLIELIPDNLPFVGNIDEAAVAAVLIACLRYFGLDVTRFWKRKRLLSDAEKNRVERID